MKTFKTLSEFQNAEKELDISEKVKQAVAEQLCALEVGFTAGEGGCVVLLDKKENLREVFTAYPAVEAIRPENTVPVDDYINQVYAGQDGGGVSVFLSVGPPPDCGGKFSSTAANSRHA